MRYLVILVILLFSLTLVQAVGISSPYWKTNPLKMYKGETKEVSYALTSRPDAETEIVQVFMVNDEGIAEIISGIEYTVEPGTVSTKVKIKVSIPETAEVGENYNVVFNAKGSPEGEKGMVQLSISYETNLPIEVIEEPKIAPEPEPEIVEERPYKKLFIIFGVSLMLLFIILLTIFFSFRRRDSFK